MTLAKFSPKRNSMKHFDSFMNEFFNNDFLSMPSKMVGGNVPSVNIAETDEEYHIEVAAPGFDKGDFKLNVENEMLTIAGEHKSEEKESNKKYSRQEFSYSTFKRMFSLPETVESESIKAEYKDGILMISIPKKEEAKEKPALEIKVS